MILRVLCTALILLAPVLSSAEGPACALPVGIINSNGESFHGLAADEFVAREGKAPLKIKSLTFDNGPRRVLIVVDMGKKLSQETRKAEKTMVETILAAGRPDDSFALIAARGPEHVVKFGEDRTAFIQAIADESESRRGKEAGVLDALMQGLPFFGDPKPGDAIVLIAADLEGNKTTNAKKVAKAVQDRNIRVFGLAVGLVSTRNAASSGQSTTAWGLATATPATGSMIYETGDEDFYPLTRNSGGLVIAVMNGDYRHTYSMKDPRFEASVKQKSQVVFNMIAGYYRMELEAPHGGEWTLDAGDSLRKAIPAMFLLYPHEIGSCQSDSHVARN